MSVRCGSDFDPLYADSPFIGPPEWCHLDPTRNSLEIPQEIQKYKSIRRYYDCFDRHDVLLPESLERAEGDIRVAGSRISLFRVTDAYFRRKSIEDMKEMFPFVPSRTLLHVIRFFVQHIELVRKYHLDSQAVVESRRAVSYEAQQEIDRALKATTESANQAAKDGRLAPEKIREEIREFRNRHPY